MGTNKNDDVRELLNRVHTFLSNLCRDARCDDHCSECIGASDLADDVYDLLHSPRRNCDALSADDVKSRFKERMASSDMGLIGENIVEVVSGVVDFLYATEKGGEEGGAK